MDPLITDLSKMGPKFKTPAPQDGADCVALMKRARAGESLSVYELRFVKQVQGLYPDWYLHMFQELDNGRV